MDKLQVIFCVGPPSINFISFALRLFLCRKLEAFPSPPFFFRKGVGTEKGREHPLRFTFQEFIFSSRKQKEKSLLTWLFHNLALL